MREKITEKKVEEIAITQSEIINAFGRIFEDELILTSKFSIVSIGNNICNFLGCKKEKVTGLSLSTLIGNALPEKELINLLKTDFFEGHQIILFNNIGETLSFIVSGFYFGRIADSNDLIILKFRHSNPVSIESMLKQLNEKNIELDNYIYETSHKLRGPLATIKGLISLLKIQVMDDKTMAFVVLQMSVFADRLDDRLHKLIYFAESDKAEECTTEGLTIKDITEKLSAFENDSPVSQKMIFIEQLPYAQLSVENGELVLVLLQNIKTFFCRNSTKDCEMTFRVTHNFIEFTLMSNSIFLGEEQQKKIDIVNFGYTEILNDPEFINLYSAKKIALKLKGRLQISVVDQKAYAHIIIPRKHTYE